MTGLNPSKHKLNWQFIKEMSVELSVNNLDGLGYTAVDRNGNIFGERWWMNHQAFNNFEPMTKPKVRNHQAINELKESVKNFVELEDESNYQPIEKYNKFGNKTQEICSITLHTRYATSGKQFQNTHPFVDDERSISLVHNGIIRNHEKADEIRSTCDSERILNKYIEYNINQHPEDVQKMIDELRGYFACGVFSLDQNNVRVLDVFKTDASLTCAYIQELGCLVFSTSLDDIRRVSNNMGLTIVSTAKSIKDCVFQRFNAVTGTPILNVSYKDPTKAYYGTPTFNNGGRWNNETHRYEWASEACSTAQKVTTTRPIVSSTLDNVKQFPSNDVRYTEQEKEEIKELKAIGFTDEEIKDEMKRKNKTVETTAKEIDKANDLIKKNVADPYNEQDAAIDDYYLDMESAIWYKFNRIM